ncbi:hypothetical protein [Lyngbya aestuarii]|uniref:hypothetical protein n=1 Tax=Lyngbya aestuarii TaxID=118322 RepID=UPI00403E1FFB
MLICPKGSLSAIAHLQLIENICQVIFNGSFAEINICRNFSIAFALTYTSELFL